MNFAKKTDINMPSLSGNCSDRNLYSDNFMWCICDALLIYCNLLFTVHFVQ